MLTPVTGSAFRRDVKRCQKRRCDMAVLKTIIDLLLKGEKLARCHHEHLLTGEWKGYSECHLAPDWLLIFCRTTTELHLVRTGSHADLFG